MNTIAFYPEHPSADKAQWIETTPLPILPQDKPIPVKSLWDEFSADADAFFTRYTDTRFEITGIAKKVGPDPHHKPSIELSDIAEGKTYALVIFPTDDHYGKVAVGDRVVIRANYLVMTNLLGLVMKHSELLNVEK